jgi:PKD repeat protein
MNLSVRWIIIIIIAIVVLLMLIFLFRNIFNESSIQVQEELAKYVIPPTAIISSPNPAGFYSVFQNLKFDGSDSYDEHHSIVGYYWDFDSDDIVDSRKEVDNYYYHEPGEYNVSLKVVSDEGAIGSTSEIVNVYTRNEKSMEQLSDFVFFIRDNDRENRQDIMRLIPVTTWKDVNGFNTIPYYVYYIPGQDKTFTEEEVKGILDRHGKKNAYFFDDAEMYARCPDKCEWGDYTIKTYRPGYIDEVYFSFWKRYDYVVLVNPLEVDSSLIASLFAAFTNSPLIFIDKDNLNDYKDVLRNSDIKHVYYIPSAISIDKEVRDFIVELNLGYVIYSAQELRNPSRRVNRIIKLTSNVTMNLD